MKRKIEFILSKMHPVEIYLIALMIAFVTILVSFTVAFLIFF